MNSRNIAIGFFGILLMVVFMLAIGCANTKSNTQTEAASGKIEIVTTIFPLYEFSKSVGGDKVQVTLLLPPGVEAHTFEPTPSDIIAVNNADIFVYIGADMEPWADDILEGLDNPGLAVFEASSKVTLIKTSEVEEHEVGNLEEEEEEEHHHGEYDPHIWLDFGNDVKIVNALADLLAQKDPENRDYYYANAASYSQELAGLDSEYRQGLSTCNQSEFITGGHSAYAYLAKSYGLEYISAYGVSPDSEPTPKTIKEIADMTEEKGIKYILFEELVSPQMAEAIAEQTGAETLVLNPASNLLKDEFSQGVTFISLMRENLVTLRTALECE